MPHHDDVIKWKHFPRNWPFLRGIHRSPVNSTHKGQWRGALMFSSICARINGWANNGEAGDLRRYRVHCDVIVMTQFTSQDDGLLFILTEMCYQYKETSLKGHTKSNQVKHPQNPLNFLVGGAIRELQPSKSLTHWGRDKMDAISQRAFSNVFSWMKMFEFRLKFHWSLFLRVQLTIFQHWFR